MDPYRPLLEAICKSEMFQNFERAYAEIAGLPVVLRPVEYWQVPLHNKLQENPFCALMAGNNRTCAACLQAQGKLAKYAVMGPATVKCAYGLCETAVPVKLGQKTIGFLQTGQLLLQQPCEESFRRMLAEASQRGVNPDDPQIRQSYFSTPVFSAQKHCAVVTLLSIFASHLSIRSNEITVQTASAESPFVSRAKQIIRDNYQEALSLKRLAREMHMSVFYFCKMFKKGAGMTFTQFVSRVRVEKAKNLLLNPHLRIGEILFEAGFQSFTHFNRVFKALVGESPTCYRDHLRISAGISCGGTPQDCGGIAVSFREPERGHGE